MNYIQRDTFKLASRNEGKIKSYESCSDLRAWSHDEETRDRYLREWIRNDMPVCIIPLSTLANFLRNMTYKNRGKVSCSWMLTIYLFISSQSPRFDSVFSIAQALKYTPKFKILTSCFVVPFTFTLIHTRMRGIVKNGVGYKFHFRIAVAW